MSRDDHGEVAAEVVASFRLASQTYAGDPLAVFGDEVEYFAQTRRRYPWTKIVRLYERAERMLPAGETMKAYGTTVLDSPGEGVLLKAMSILASPSRLILLGNRFGLARSFSHLEVSQELRPDGSIHIEVAIPEVYEDCPGFFHVVAGVLQAFPRILGLPDADVFLDLQPRRGLYRVVPPPSRTLAARLVRKLRSFLGAERLIAELTEQRLELNERIQQLDRVNRELMDALEVRDRFLELISHELQTPMNGIMGAVQTLTSPGEGHTQEAVADLKESSERLRFVIGDILELGKARSRGIERSTQRFSLHGLLESIQRRFRPLAESKGLELRVGAPDLPEHVNGDKNRIERIFVHLVDNAIKFTELGHVELRVRHDGNHLELMVTDTGVGIPDADQKRIFEAFTQVEGHAKRRQQGSGLGLALVKVIIEAIEGNMTVQSSVGVGTSFHVRFPLEPAQNGSSIGAIDPKLPVLVVDDDRMNRRVLGRCIERLGLSVLTAENGREGAEMALSKDLALVIMDYEMPDMDGVESTLAIKAGKPELLVLGWSASARKEVREAMHAAGVEDFLDKPLSASSLLDALRSRGLEHDPAVAGQDKSK